MGIFSTKITGGKIIFLTNIKLFFEFIDFIFWLNLNMTWFLLAWFCDSPHYCFHNFNIWIGNICFILILSSCQGFIA